MSSTAGPSVTHDVRTDILSEAVRPDAGEPVMIRIRPELHARLCRECAGGTEPSLGIPLVVDRDIPTFPGYEIHRAVPQQRSAYRSTTPLTRAG